MKVVMGKTYTYFPKKEHVDDNLHFPVEVIELRDYGRVKVRMPEGKTKFVSQKRLADQLDLLDKT